MQRGAQRRDFLALVKAATADEHVADAACFERAHVGMLSGLCRKIDSVARAGTHDAERRDELDGSASHTSSAVMHEPIDEGRHGSGNEVSMAYLLTPVQP